MRALGRSYTVPISAGELEACARLDAPLAFARNGANVDQVVPDRKASDRAGRFGYWYTYTSTLYGPSKDMSIAAVL